MKFLFGSQNYGFDLIDSDKDYMQFYYPTAEGICKAIPSPKETKHEDGSMTKYVDIRALPNLLYKSNVDILQLLYSKEVIDGGFLQEYFKLFEEELSTINIPRLYQSVMGSAINRFKKDTPKDLAHIIFGFDLLINFEKNGFTNMRSCFEHGKEDYYRSIRTSGKKEYWTKVAREMEQFALSKKESFMAQNPNDSFMDKLNFDIGSLVINTLGRGVYGGIQE
jgi:hypothetical protein